MTNSETSKLKDWLELAKLKIMIPVSLTGFTGYFAFDSHITAKALFTTLGILLMAVSASVLNQIQEITIDSKMIRTSNRPLPTHRIRIQDAAILVLLSFAAGTIIIYFFGNLTATLVGLITMIWYNGIYTYSKKITAFAVVPGALTGALPPLIGWVAAGGGLWEKPIIFIEFLLFIGQIPHFWLLILKYGEEYKQAGVPSLTNIFNRFQIRRLTFIWVLSSVVAALFLCCFEIIQSPLINIIIVAVSIYMIWQFIDLIRIRTDTNNYKKYSIVLDVYFLLILLLLISDRIIT
jgi:protoheme IX farnesyltransferase